MSEIMPLADPTPELPTAAPTLNPTIGTLVALGVTLDETTACLLENVSGTYRLAGWMTMQREPGASLTQQGAMICRALGDRLERALWDEENNSPFIQSPDPLIFPPLEHFTVAVSPRARMRIWLVGMSNESLTVTRSALASAPLQVSGITMLTSALKSSTLATQLSDHQPEALVIVGGYDEPEPDRQQWLLTLCQVVGQALGRLSPSLRPTVFYAGNRWAADAADALLRPEEGPLTIHLLNNILPYPGYSHGTELPVALSQLYWRLCQRMPGFAQLSRWVTPPGHVANLESSFAQLVEIWMDYQGLPRLHGLYCTPHWWLHVWAEAGASALDSATQSTFTQASPGVQLRFVKPETRPHEFADWPPLQLVSGAWPLQLWRNHGLPGGIAAA
ncbi:MAG: glutamate mutase L [Caldilineaceae bacterium]